MAPLKAVLPGARWTVRSTWHVTLKFFGEVPEDRLDSLREGVVRALVGEKAVGSSLLEIGAFPSMARARVLWAGIEDSQLRLARMAERIGAECGIPEDRPLHPHLTLARMKVPAAIGQVVDRFRPFALEREPFVIDKVTLFRSHQPVEKSHQPVEKKGYTERTGSRYEVIAEWELSTK